MVSDSIALLCHVQPSRLATTRVHGDLHLCVSLPQCLNLLASRSSNGNTNRPTYAYWSFPEPAGSRCLNEGPVTIVGGLVKIAVDILITTLPIPLIMRMNMQKKQRYMVSILLGLGYIVCIAGAVRAYYTWKAFYNTNDTMWYEYPAFIASGLENNLAIVSLWFLSSEFLANEGRFAPAFPRYDLSSHIYSAVPCLGSRTGCLRRLHRIRFQILTNLVRIIRDSLKPGLETPVSTSILFLRRSITTLVLEVTD